MAILAYVEHALPGASTRERAGHARRLGLALEVASRPGTDWRGLRRAALPIVTLQPWGLHEEHALHPDPERRRAGLGHLLETLELAARLGVPRVLFVCGFGDAVADEPFERALEHLRLAVPLARSLGVRLLLEPLSPRRAAAMTDPAELERLALRLDAPDVLRSAVDVGHLLDAGRDPERFLASWRLPVEELQLRGPDSAPPPPELDVAALLRALPRPPEVVAVEHRTPLAPDALGRLVADLRRRLRTD